MRKSPAMAAEIHYTGALDGLESRIATDAFDPVLFSRKLYESAPLKLTFRAQNRKQTEAWQKQLRAKVTELLGGFPAGAWTECPDPRGPRIPSVPARKVHFRKPSRTSGPRIFAHAHRR